MRTGHLLTIYLSLLWGGGPQRNQKKIKKKNQKKKIKNKVKKKFRVGHLRL